MERAVALTKLRKLLGKSLNYRVDPKAPNAEERAELRSEFARQREKTSELDKRLNTRRDELLNADEQYRIVGEAYRASRKRQDELAGKLYSRKFSVGVSSGPFNFIKAEGDSWEEVIDKLTKEKTAA